EDLDRWTGAIGFCDVVSLYLCSGTRETVELPLGHPGLPESRHARKVLLEWRDGSPRFSSPVIQTGHAVSIELCLRVGAGIAQRIRGEGDVRSSSPRPDVPDGRRSVSPRDRNPDLGSVRVVWVRTRLLVRATSIFRPPPRRPERQPAGHAVPVAWHFGDHG